MNKPVGVGVIGCGAISGAYLKAARTFPILDLVALADARPGAAQARAAEFGLRAVSVEALLADPAAVPEMLTILERGLLWAAR